MSRPGFFASSAAEIILTRSMTRLRFGAPGVEKCRLKCSRLTPTSAASAAVRTGRPAPPRIDFHVARCIGVFNPSDTGGSANAAMNRAEKVRGATRSFATLSSMPSARTSQNSSDTHRAIAGASVGRRGVIPKKGELGNSWARLAIFHVSSADATDIPAAAKPSLIDVAPCAPDPMSTSTASTSVRRSVFLNSPRSLRNTRRQRRFGNADLTNARARSRGVYATIVGRSSASAPFSLDTSFHQLEVGLAFNELADDRIVRVLNFVYGSDLSHCPFVQHRDA